MLTQLMLVRCRHLIFCVLPACWPQALLTACSKGRVERVREVLTAGCSPDASDYDRRTGLMLAAAHGHAGVVSCLLSAGANPNMRDAFGGCALLEAVKAGHDSLMTQLKSAGAWLQLSRPEMANTLCDIVAENNTQLLLRYIAAGERVGV
jgi:ankyrin repeat protein